MASAKRVSVTNYSTQTGEITLQNKSPSSLDKLTNVDVNLLLETLKTSDTRIGEWVNVIGYVTKQESKKSNHGTRTVEFTSIQAIVYWSAGSLKVDEYEEVVAESQNVHLTM